MRGYVALPMMWGSEFRVYGGPYMKIPKGMVGVKMAAEIKVPCEVNIPTVDYQVPELEDMKDGLFQAVEYIASGRPVYAGCMGGIGRTGLFLAIVCKAWGITDPIAYVRANYYAHAVETDQQRKYVDQFVIDPTILKMIKWAKVKNLFKFKKVLTDY